MNLFRFNGTSFVVVPIVPVLTSGNDGVGLTFLNGDPVIASVTAASKSSRPAPARTQQSVQNNRPLFSG